MLCLLLSSCAQPSDLIRLQKNLEERITKLDLEKKKLEQAVSQANTALEKVNATIDQQSSAVAGLTRARAEFRQELKRISEAELTAIIGDIESESHRIDQLLRELPNVKQQIAMLHELREKHVGEAETQMKALESRLEKQDAQIKAGGKRTESLAEQVDQHNQVITDQMTEFQGSLKDFKQALASLKQGLGGQEAQVKTVKEQLDREVQDTQALRGHLKDVTSSIDSIAKALERTSGKLASSIDDQAHRFDQVHIGIEQQMQGLIGQLLVHTTQLSEVTKSVTQFREALDQTGATLSKRVDEQVDQVVQLREQLSQLEDHQSTLSGKLNADTQVLRDYLEQDVNVSIDSVARALEEEKRRGDQRAANIEGTIQQLKVEVQNDMVQVQELNQSVVKLREALDVMGGVLGKRVDEQVQRIGQLTERLSQIEQRQVSLDADAQATSTHLAEVRDSVTSVTNALESSSETLASRVDDQDRRLTEVTGTLQMIRKIEGELQTEVRRLNELTQTMTQLREVIDAFGTKMGGRVDEHEERLAKLAQQLSQLQQTFSKSNASSPATPTNSSP